MHRNRVVPSISRLPGLRATSTLLCLGLITSLPAIGQQDSPSGENFKDVTPEDCAVVKDGVQRLACYDAINKPGQAREQASEEKRKAMESSVEGLEYRELAEAEDGNSTLEGMESEDTEGTDDDSGVMSNMIGRYAAAEQAIFSFSGSFVGHRPMYILPFTYMRGANRNPSSPRLGTTGYDYGIDNQEAKYQISFKVPLLTGWLDDRTTLWFGYTQKSFWQVFNTDDSAPFRETDYEPEIFLRYAADYDIGPGALSGLSLGIAHESNGQAEPRSRSWNRITANVAYTYRRWLFMVRPWYRLPETGSEDDNADIERYLGHADYMAIYKWSEDRTFSLTLQNNLRSDSNKTSIEVGYSFPMGDSIKGYVQYFNGYGESLIDYNERIQRIGVGIMLNDWL